MAIYYNTETNEYPRHDGDLELLGWSTGAPLPAGWAIVHPTAPPAVSGDEIAYEVLPQLVDSQWLQSWDTREMTLKEIERRDNPEEDPTKKIL